MARTALGDSGIRWTLNGSSPINSLQTLELVLATGYTPLLREQKYNLTLPQLPEVVRPGDRIVFPLHQGEIPCGNITTEYRTQTQDNTTFEKLPAHVYNVWWNIYAEKSKDLVNSKRERDRFLREVR